MIDGIDISHWQGTIEWPLIPDRYKFAFIKASEGSGWTDDMFALNWAAAGDQGIKRGAYHFWRAAYDAEAQANHFFNTVVQTGDLGELPPVIDIEDTYAAKQSTTPGKIIDIEEYVEDRFGQKPIIYTACWYWDTWVRSYALGDNPLWTAHYKAQWLGNPCVPMGWDDWQIWQYSSHGRIPGIGGNVDWNVAKDEWFAQFDEPSNGENYAEDLHLIANDLAEISHDIRDIADRV